MAGCGWEWRGYLGLWSFIYFWSIINIRYWTPMLLSLEIFSFFAIIMGVWSLNTRFYDAYFQVLTGIEKVMALVEKLKCYNNIIIPCHTKLCPIVSLTVIHQDFNIFKLLHVLSTVLLNLGSSAINLSTNSVRYSNLSSWDVNIF